MKTKRLLKLAAHLESGKLGHKRFDFEQFNTGCEQTCGAAGCAIGECPVVFPKAWKFGRAGLPLLVGTNRFADPFKEAEKFFVLSGEEVMHLFAAGEQQPKRFGGRRLGGRAKAASVAANIRAFVERKARKRRVAA